MRKKKCRTRLQRQKKNNKRPIEICSLVVGPTTTQPFDFHDLKVHSPNYFHRLPCWLAMRILVFYQDDNLELIIIFILNTSLPDSIEIEK